MKILAVHLRNLNSLTGSWAIDFTAPEYAASGIFAITGPTGAGKSTILDAICLALFARTPRLGHISKSSNEIMSRRTGDCFAEVVFETRQGCYRCHWGQHRARRSAEGDLQPPRHEIVDARTGKVLETRSREIGRLVEQVTGMDYDRFTRSILLAQGDFAAFLEADADQRAPILEQITGTSIYSRISMAVHERTSEERKKTTLLQEAIGNVSLFSEEEEKALATGISESAATAAGLQQQLAALGEGLHRIRTIAELKAQLGATEQLLLELALRREQAGEDLKRLEQGQRAQSLLSDYTRWQHLQERITRLRSQGEQFRADQERLHQERTGVAVEHARARTQVQEGLARQTGENEVIKQVRTLDLLLHANKKIREQVTLTLQQAQSDQQQHLQRRAALVGSMATIAAQQERIETFFREHASDHLLVEHLAAFRHQLLQLQEQENDLGRLQKLRVERGAAQEVAEQNRSRLQQEAETAGQHLRALQQRQTKLGLEIRELLAGRDPATWRQEIEEYQQRLRDLAKLAELLTRQENLGAEQRAAGSRTQELQSRQQQLRRELEFEEAKKQVQLQLVAQLEHNQQLAQRIRSYEEERRRLVDGAHCPLCGATSHPWAGQEPVAAPSDEPSAKAKAELERMQGVIAGHRELLVGLVKDLEYASTGMDQRQQQLLEIEQLLAPLLPLAPGGEGQDRRIGIARLVEEQQVRLTNASQRIKTVEELEAQLQGVQQQREQALARHAELLGQVQTAHHASETALAESRNLEEQEKVLMTHLDRCRIDLGQQLQPLGISDFPPHQAEQLLAQLAARQQAWKAHLQQQERLTKDMAQLRGERDKEDLLLTAIEGTLTRGAAELETLDREGARLLEERMRLYQDRNPDLEEQKLKNLVHRAEAREAEIRSRLIAIDKDLHGLAEQERLGAEELAALLPQSQQQERSFLARLPAAGFPDLAFFTRALLPPEELAALTTLKEQLAKEHTVLLTRRAEQAAALQREEAKDQSQKSEAELLEEQRVLGRKLEVLQQRIGADRERLIGNSLRKQQFAEQQGALADQRKEQERWDLLHQLIGSADGKKFRVFAQGLTFDLMISHANRQLRKMNDRYILLRDPREPLALQVLDNYQAGEVRSTRNLSGGESFIVSLALSLGLSAMASHNVRVDSLFLDEGFGSLDEDALDTALQTLAELRQDGKLIGIISHVGLLQDRIDVRIQVVPGAGGCSRLKGPGCRTIS